MDSSFSHKWNRNILSDLDINPKIEVSARKAGFVSAVSILGASQIELEEKLKLSSFHVKNFTEAVINYVLPKETTVYDMSVRGEGDPVHLTTGCHDLDSFLGGGMPLRGITEVAGESASGKTQVALQLSLCAQLSPSLGGLGKGVAYICTESQFPATRLQQMIQHFKEKYNTQGPPSYTDHIFVHHIPDMDSLVDCVRYQLPILLSQQSIGLVIIDSIASPFRAEQNTMENKAILHSLGYRLHQLAATHCVGVVTVNQVTAAIDNNNLYGRQGDVVPTLGLSWSNLVTTRLLIERTHSHVPEEYLEGEEEEGRGEEEGNHQHHHHHHQVKKKNKKVMVRNNVRRIEVMWCPWIDRRTGSFVVTSRGIENVG